GQGLAIAVLSLMLGTTERGQQPPTPAEPARQNPPAASPQNPQSPTLDRPAQSNTPAPAAQSAGQASPPLSLGDAVQQAIAQVSSFQQAQLEERIAAEDVRQARLAFLPRPTSSLSFIYNSPAHGPAAQAETFSFIAANAVREYEALVGVTGDIDL